MPPCAPRQVSQRTPRDRAAVGDWDTKVCRRFPSIAPHTRTVRRRFGPGAPRHAIGRRASSQAPCCRRCCPKLVRPSLSPRTSCCYCCRIAADLPSGSCGRNDPGTTVANITVITESTAYSEHLDRLAEFDSGGNPVISLYLNAQPDEHGRDKFSTFLRKELRGRAASYPADSASRKSLERDVEKIEAYIASELKPSANGLAIFACSAADDFFEALQLDA